MAGNNFLISCTIVVINGLSLAAAVAHTFTDEELRIIGQKMIEAITIVNVAIPFYWRGKLVFKSKILTLLSLLPLGIIVY